MDCTNSNSFSLSSPPVLMSFSEASAPPFFFLFSLPKLMPLPFSSFSSVYFWITAYSSASFINSRTFPLYFSSCLAAGAVFCGGGSTICLLDFSSGGGGGASSSYSLGFFAGSGFSGFLRRAAEGGLSGFFISFFSGSVSFPSALFT